MQKGRILVVDDKENMLKLFAKILGEGYDIATANNGTRALALLAGQPFDVVVTDIRMPDADGFQILDAVKQRWPDTEVVMMTAYASIQKAVEAIKKGAYDYLQKPFDPDDVSLVIARALERKRLREQATTLRKALDGAYGFESFVGKSSPMRDAYTLIERAAALDITVLVTGESGTGKELAARAIHYRSSRRGKSFVPVNCGALPSELIESELFGHVKGSFTGAMSDRPGLFEEAAGGTIFFDEIGELPLPAQVKLNRAFQDREIRRVGENTPVTVDVRVIAATHRDLKAEIQAGRFREDLFYRLHVFPIPLPPLRERRDDIPLLATYFLRKYGEVYSRQIDGLDPDALGLLTGYSWPGNVRELENAIERAVAVASGKLVMAEDLPKELRHGKPLELPAEILSKMPFRKAVETARDRVSREYLVTLLQEFKGNVTHAAERACMERGSLHRLLKRYAIRSDDFKGSG